MRGKINKYLAFAALGLGFIAVFLGNPVNKGRATVDTKALAIQISDSSNRISSLDLADWIIKGNADYRLIDLRKEDKYNEYHIPSAENIEIGVINESDLAKNQKIILYSEDEFSAAQAWFLLKAKGFTGVYFLKGGLNSWRAEVLFPVQPSNSSAASLAEFNKLVQVSKYFGGAPQAPRNDSTSTLASAPAPEMPKIAAPVPSGSGGKKAKPKKEGC
jgi:rhodanese-related sulfurtransferase